MKQWIDIPPVWLALCIALAWVQFRFFGFGLALGGWADFLGGLLLGGGVLLMVMAVAEFRRHKTTFVPHRDADRLIQSGIFRHSRNPIYLGDVAVLAGLILRMDAVLALPLVPILLWVLEKRFVIPEEDRLRRRFRAEFANYCRLTRRWI